MKKLILISVVALCSCATQQGYYNAQALMPDSASVNWSPNQTTFNMNWN